MLRRRTTATALVALALAVTFTACFDDRSPTGISGIRSTANITDPDLDTQIGTLIPQLFPGGLGTVLQARWAMVKRQSVKNLSGRTHHVQLVRWIQLKTPSITPVAGETQERSAARLVLLMSLYLYEGPAFTPPALSPTADVALGIVTPQEENSVVTPEEQAAVLFPADAVEEPTVVVVAENPEHFPQKCSGPLDTKLCQYPLFYHFNVFPNKKLKKPAKVTVCHVNQGVRGPLADHERFRIAHGRPSDPNAEVEGGTIVDGIEILPFVTIDEGVVNCDEDGDYPPPPPDISSLGRVLYEAKRLAHNVGRALTPKSLYAIDRGGGGEVEFFSDFGVVDPESKADLEPSAFVVSDTQPVRGTDVAIGTFTISNGGNASAHGAAPAIVLAQDSALTTGVQFSVPLATVSVMEPGASSTISGVFVNIPSGTPLGNYFLGVRADWNNAVAESDETNNFVSLAIVVRDPYTTFCPDGPPGSYSDLRDAVIATPPGGTLVVCDGEYDADSVVIDKPLTLRSQNPAGATLRAVHEVNGLQTGRPALFVDGYASGTVRIEDIRFTSYNRAIIVGRLSIGIGGGPETPPTSVEHPGVFDKVEIHNARFYGRHAEFSSGVWITPSSVPTATVDITNSHFDNHGIGVFHVSSTVVNVSHSLFENFTSGSVTFSGYSGAVGQHLYSRGTVTDNLIRNCAPIGCFRGVLIGNAVIARNTFEAPTGVVRPFAIWIRRQIQETDPQPIIVEDNIVVGGRVFAVDSLSSEGWQLRSGIQVEDATAAVNVVRRNTVTDAWRGLLVSQGNLSGNDNVISGGAYGVAKTTSGSFSFHRNDVTGTLKSFITPNPNVGSLQCNWWGSTAGPQNYQPPDANPSLFTPWALEPIANKPLVNCSS